MFRTVKFKSASEGRFRTVLIKPDRTMSHNNSVLLTMPPSVRRMRMMMAAFVVMSLSLLPTCRAYSITSSLGPSAFALDVQNGPTPRVPSQGPPPPQSLSTVRRDTTAVPDLTSESVLLSSASLDSETEKSYVTRSADTEMSRTGISHNINFSNQADDHHHQTTASLTNQQQHTRTQLQVAGRILFESRVTTPKPTFGYRAFLSSYRNPNYFVKKTKYSESSFIPNRSKNANVYATSSSSQMEEEDEDEGEEESEDVHDESPTFHSSFINLTTAKTLTAKSVKSPNPSASTLYHQPKEITTAHSKTAPATSAYSASGRPSSTQQMQSDSPHQFPLNLSESESNNHYQFNNRDHQQWAGYVSEKRAVQIDPPTPTNRSSSSRSPHDLSNGEVSKGDGVEGITAVPLGPDFKGPKEEPIIFPTTTSTQRTYKIPTHWLEEADLNGLKNLLGVRKGSEDVKPKEGESSTTDATVEKFSPVPQGAKEPACAKNLGYCDIESFKDNYPKELLNSVLTNSVSSDFFRNVFGDDSEAGATAAAGSPDNFVLAGRNNINVNIPAEESALCGSQEVTIYPRVARNKDDKWMFIVNHDDYVQGVKVEKCMNEGSPCLFSEGNPLGYESVCRQKFILRKLVALNGEGKTALDTFKLPSCCVCYIKSSHVSNRIGIGTSSAPRTPVLSDKSSTGPSPIFSSSSTNEGSGEVNDNNGPTGCTPFNIVPPKTTDSNSNNNATSHTNNNSSSLVFAPTSPINTTSARPLLS